MSEHLRIALLTILVILMSSLLGCPDFLLLCFIMLSPDCILYGIIVGHYVVIMFLNLCYITLVVWLIIVIIYIILSGGRMFLLFFLFIPLKVLYLAFLLVLLLWIILFSVYSFLPVMSFYLLVILGLSMISVCLVYRSPLLFDHTMLLLFHYLHLIFLCSSFFIMSIFFCWFFLALLPNFLVPKCWFPVDRLLLVGLVIGIG